MRNVGFPQSPFLPQPECWNSPSRLLNHSDKLWEESQEREDSQHPTSWGLSSGFSIFYHSFQLSMVYFVFHFSQWRSQTPFPLLNSLIQSPSLSFWAYNLAFITEKSSFVRPDFPYLLIYLCIKHSCLTSTQITPFLMAQRMGCYSHSKLIPICWFGFLASSGTLVHQLVSLFPTFKILNFCLFLSVDKCAENTTT